MTAIPDIRPHFREKALLDLTRELISHDSSAPPGREEGVARRIAEFLGDLGFETRLDVFAPERANLIARLRGKESGAAPTLAFNGHLDVVPPGNAAWTTPPFAPDIRNGLLYGRGAADMKGGIAAAMYAAAMLRDAGVRLQGDLLFALDADEEVTNLGLRKMLADGVFSGVSACVIGEPTGLDIAVGHRGVAGITATFSGTSTHAAQAWRGVNAIEHASRFVLKAAELARRKHASMNHPLLGPSLITATVIEGGFRVNVVPESCRLSLDARLVPGETLASLMAELEGLAEELRREIPGFAVSFAATTYCPPGITDTAHPIIGAIRQAAAGVAGANAAVKGFEASGELSLIAEEAGVPTVFFGPGNIAQAHTADEFIAIDQLTAAALAYAGLFMRYLGATCSKAPAETPST